MLSIAAVVAGLGVACGSKSGLSDGLARSVGAGGSASPGGSAGTGGTSGTGGTAGDASADAAPLPPCLLVPTTEPLEVVAYPEGGVGDVDLEGANFWHPELRVARIAIGVAWPEDLVILDPPTLFGFDAHSGGLMSRAANGTGLALAFYHADEASPNVVPSFNFRSFDPGKWSPGAELVIDPMGGSAFALATGTNGYAVAYRATADVGYEPRVALLDAGGKLIASPLSVAPAADYPGVGASVAAHGAGYLLATALGHCPGAGESCGPPVIGLAAISADPEPSLQPYAPIPYLAPDNIGLRPSLASFGDRVWLAWREVPAANQEGPWSIRVAAVGSGGGIEVGPILLATNARPQNGVGIHVSDLGVVVSWAQVSVDTLEPSMIGHSMLVFHQLDHDGVPMQQPFAMQVTELAFDPPHSMVRLAHPRSLVVGWAGRGPFDAGPHRGLLARLECAP